MCPQVKLWELVASCGKCFNASKEVEWKMAVKMLCERRAPSTARVPERGQWRPKILPTELAANSLKKAIFSPDFRWNLTKSFIRN